jgi:RNA polymerase sigma factor (sigma-70 family)
LSGKTPKERAHYFIPLPEGRAFEVTRAVYLCWYAGERQAKYQIERDRQHHVYSFEYLNELALRSEANRIGDVFASPEDSAEEQIVRNQVNAKLYAAINRLEPEEQKLIRAIFFEDVSLRNYAKQEGVTHRAILKRRNYILKKLRKLME